MKKEAGCYTKRFYRGELDDQVVTVANGAKVNKGYADFLTNGIWEQTETRRVTDRIRVVTGLSLSNFALIEGDTGIILFNTGGNDGTGLELLETKSSFSDKPVSAIIYSHHHYTNGTDSIQQAHPGREIPIYGHPATNQTRISAGELGPADAIQCKCGKFCGH